MMPYVDTPLTREMREAVSSACGLDVGDAGERLFGGKESAVFHIGAEVVRIGPAWRTTAELEPPADGDVVLVAEVTGRHVGSRPRAALDGDALAVTDVS